MDACGIDVHGEEGYCTRHLAEQLGVPKHRVDYLRQSRQIVAHRADDIHCGTRRRGECLVPLGEVLTNPTLEEG